MNAFTQVAHRQQLDLDEPPFIGGENPSLADCCSPAEEVFRWKQLELDDQAAARSAIVHAFMYRDWGAAEAFNALVAFDLFGDLKSFMETYAAGVEAMAARLPSPGVRSLTQGDRT